MGVLLWRGWEEQEEGKNAYNAQTKNPSSSISIIIICHLILFHRSIILTSLSSSLETYHGIMPSCPYDLLPSAFLCLSHLSFPFLLHFLKTHPLTFNCIILLNVINLLFFSFTIVKYSTLAVSFTHNILHEVTFLQLIVITVLLAYFFKNKLSSQTHLPAYLRCSGMGHCLN